MNKFLLSAVFAVVLLCHYHFLNRVDEHDTIPARKQHRQLTSKLSSLSITSNPNELYITYKSEMLSLLVGLFVNRYNAVDEIISSKDKNNTIAYHAQSDICNISSLVNRHTVVNISSLNSLLQGYIDELDITQYNSNNSSNATAAIPAVPAAPSIPTLKDPKYDTLICFTTCNELKMTIESLEYIKKSLDMADLVVVDDHSIDGTVQYLQKKGYYVIEKDEGKGLTNSWNLAFEAAVKLRYKYIFYINNDVLLPYTALASMRKVLLYEAVVVPLTTSVGAGHNPSQSILTAYNMSNSYLDYINDPKHTDAIQLTLYSKFCKGNTISKVVPSLYRGKVRFNGFMFGINIELLKPAIYQYPTLLFDDKLIMVGQEDDLVNRMVNASLRLPKISLCSYLYHYKSVTVSKALDKSINVTNAKVANPYADKMNDKRNDLAYFHPELLPTANTSTADTGYPLISRYQQIPYRRYINFTLPIIKSYPSFNLKTLADKNQQIIISASCTTDSRYVVIDNNDSQIFTIGFITSDPISNPSAGDIFTAYELGDKLLDEYENIEIMYLRQGSNWYDPVLLSKIDILIVLLDKYDLPRALQAKDDKDSKILRRVKPTLFTIAWMRNWFQRWISSDWIGNYDLILTSSLESKAFVEELSKSVGLKAKCIWGCPVKQIATTRSYVPVEVLRIGTNSKRFSKDIKGDKQFRADYVFTGSYYNYTRKIMSFDPAALPMYNGIIIGKGWKGIDTDTVSPPITKAFQNISIGYVPYSKMPSVYRSVKIVIDDSNHVTLPFGSVNSRVFDALSTGSLVVSNCVKGISEIFPLLPTYTTAAELTDLLSYYLSNKNERVKLSKLLYDDVTHNHTYTNRAKELHHILRKFHFHLKRRIDEVNTGDRVSLLPSLDDLKDNVTTKSDGDTVTAISHALCIGIRTIEKHGDALDILVRSLYMQYDKSKHRSEYEMLFFIVNTEASTTTFYNKIINTVDNINTVSGQKKAFFIHDDDLKRKEKNIFYGYDETDLLVQMMLDIPQCRNGYILITNGDNMYNTAFFDAIVPQMLDTSVNMIMWDFITHHPRGSNNNEHEQPIRAEIKRGFIDLGSCAIKATMYMNNNALFLPDAMFTTDLFARDYMLINNIYQSIDNSTVKSLHRLLLFHQ